MKALSIQQPWSHAILHQGKRIENRTWPTKFRGPFLIHASKGKKSYGEVNPDGWLEVYKHSFPGLEELAFGAIVGMADLIDCISFDEWNDAFELRMMEYADEIVPDSQLSESDRAMLSNWCDGPWCFVLSNVKAFDKPIPFKGALNFFSVPDSLVGDLAGQALQTA
jgi:hypothetical protein